MLCVCKDVYLKTSNRRALLYHDHQFKSPLQSGDFKNSPLLHAHVTVNVKLVHAIRLEGPDLLEELAVHEAVRLCRRGRAEVAVVCPPVIVDR